MTATEARRIATQAVKGPNVTPLLEAVYAEVKKAAEKGERAVAIPIEPFKVDPKTLVALYHILADDGYKTCTLPVPDDEQEHRIYTQISW